MKDIIPSLINTADKLITQLQWWYDKMKEQDIKEGDTVSSVAVTITSEIGTPSTEKVHLTLITIIFQIHP